MIPFDIGDPANPNAPYTPGRPITLPGSTARLIAINDSPYQILLQFGGLGNAGGVNFKVPSGVARIFPVQANAQQVSWMIDQSLAPATAVISDLTLETYTLGEELPNQYPIVRQISVGNSIVTNTSPANALEQDLLTPFVVYGLVCTKNGAHANQLDMTNGLALIRQADSSVGRVAPTTQSFLTSTPSATYFLDLNPDGTFSWGTTHSTQTNYLTICQVTTDVSANIATVTDARRLFTNFLNGMLGTIFIPTQLNVQDAVSPIQAVLSSAPVSDTVGIYLNVSGDTRNRAQLYVRGADGYGGLAGGPGGATAATAHLYAQATGWVMQEALAGLGGQASAGSFGAPVIVAQALDVHVTATTVQTIVSWTPPAAGLYRVSAAFTWANAVNTGVTLQLTWGDPHGSATAGSYFLRADTDGFLNNMSYIAPGPAATATLPITISAGTGAPIKVIFQDGAGTPNDFVSVLVERLA